MAAIEAELPLPNVVETWIDVPFDDGAEVPPVDLSMGPRIARRRARLEAQLRMLEATYRAEADALKAWHDSEAGRLGAEARRVDQVLHALLHRAMEADPKRRSLALPYGVTVKARKVPAQFRWEKSAAADAVLVRLLDGSEYVVRDPHLSWSALKADLRRTEDGAIVLGPTGDVLPSEAGVTWDDSRDEYSVKVEGGEDGV